MSFAPHTESIEELRARAASLRAQLAHLKSQQHPSPLLPPPSLLSVLPSLKPLPSSSRSNNNIADSLPSFQSKRDKELQGARELSRTYRIVGRSVFGVELARGKRARAEWEGKGKGKGKEEDGKEKEFTRKGVAVRLETFYEGRFYEPYYIVFAPQPPSSATSDAPPPLSILHHTIPSWVPLRSLSSRYLGVRIRGDQDLTDDDGSVLSSEFDKQDYDLDLFLTKVNTLLTAGVSRREQLLLLRTKYGSGVSSEDSEVDASDLDFRIFSSEGSERIIVEWDLGTERTMVVQIAFGGKMESDKVGGKAGGSHFVRCLTRKEGQERAEEEVLDARDTDHADGNIFRFVSLLVTETTQEGWAL